MNLILLLFVIVIIILIQRQQNKEKYETFKLLNEWKKKIKQFKQYNVPVYLQIICLLRKYAKCIHYIETINWNQIPKCKLILPELIQKINNAVHSLVHSIPYSQSNEFNILLKELSISLHTTAYNTIVKFYQLCPNVSSSYFDFEIYKHPDWFLHNNNDPKSFDPNYNPNYDYFV